MPSGYPKTFPRTHKSDSQAELFDPAVKHYDQAFKLGEPRFKDPLQRQSWYDARQQVMEHLLAIVSHSPWKPNLLLRGSVLLKTWFGEKARDPGDLDWVVLPSTLKMEDPRVNLFEMLLHRVQKHAQLGTVELLAHQVQQDDIWMYEKAPGRRVVFPWQTPEGLTGTVQLDFVFGERVPSSPVPFTFVMADGTERELLSASKEQSLAWKLLWLHTDTYPQGKDLYDAVLLAEDTSLDAELLRATLDTDPYREILRWEDILTWDVDWIGFLKEYPNLGPEIRGWQASHFLDRLASALVPTFQQRGNQGTI